MEIRTKVPLREYATFHIGGHADYFAEVTTIEELKEAVRFAKDAQIPWHIIGEGSNILFDDQGVRGLIIKNAIGGIAYEEEDDGVLIRAGSGVSLDALIGEVVLRGWWGLENLSSIPGTVGATPVQNVGAYGVEVASRIRDVLVYDTKTDAIVTLMPDDCRFGYRHSIFKDAEGAHLVILQVTFFLPKTLGPELSYKDLALRFHKGTPTVAQVRDAVILIRKGKFPDWRDIGTAGSFFKNPIVTEDVFADLKAMYPQIVGHAHEGKIKLSLGWILDHVCNLRGVEEGNVGTYKEQALVLVAKRGASANEVISFAKKITARVFEMTHITIEWEVTYKK